MNKLNPFPAQKIVCMLLVVFMAVGLKYAYSQSTSEDLAWILGPTASLVEWISGIPFVREVNVGYINTVRQIAIIPACAGINFMMAAFCMLALTLIYHLQKKRYLALCVLAGFAAAYTFTLVANSLRIILSIYLYQANIYTFWMTPEKIHRIAGVAIYFVSLVLLYSGVRQITSRHKYFLVQSSRQANPSVKSSLLACGIPLFWYLLVALALPTLNHASRKNPALFREHSGYVLAVSLFLFVLMFLPVMCYKLKHQKHGTTGHCYEAADSDRG